MKFINYNNGAIEKNSFGPEFNPNDCLLYKQIMDNRLIENKLKNIYNDWCYSYEVFNKNTEKKDSNNLKFLIYSLKIILNSFTEFLDKIKRIYLKQFESPGTRPKPDGVNNPPTTRGGWMFFDLTHRYYDNNFCYRLCSALRNYVQHVDTESLDLLQMPNRKIKFVLSLESYISNYNRKSSFMTELQKIKSVNDKVDLNEEIDNLAVVIKTMYKEIENDFIDVIIENRVHHHLTMLYLYSKYKLDNIKQNALLNDKYKSKMVSYKISNIYIENIAGFIVENSIINFPKLKDFNSFLQKLQSQPHKNSRYTKAKSNQIYTLSLADVLDEKEKNAFIRGVERFVNGLNLGMSN